MKPKCWSCETENPEYDERGFCTACDAPKENPDGDEQLFDEAGCRYAPPNDIDCDCARCKAVVASFDERQQLTKPENVIVVPPPVL